MYSLHASWSRLRRCETRLTMASDGRGMDYATLKRLLAALEHHGVTYAVFGAVALNLHGLARFTETWTSSSLPKPPTSTG